MPEIAEVETVRRVLKSQILSKTVKKVNIIYPRMIEKNSEDLNKLVNQSLKDINRRGKWLIFEFDEYFLLSHLRMEGKYFLKSSEEDVEKHEHIILTFSDNTDLRYHDTRKFGRMLLVTKKNYKDVEQINKQGIEANDTSLSAEYLKEKLKSKRLPIKTVLLDQEIISGLGNIYVNEVLFQAKINPLRGANTLNDKELKEIIKASIAITNEAIEMGGTTIKSYTSSLGVTGRFQQKLKVQNRENEKCIVCQEKIKKIKVGGRGTYYCPNCQKNS